MVPMAFNTIFTNSTESASAHRRDIIIKINETKRFSGVLISHAASALALFLLLDEMVWMESHNTYVVPSETVRLQTHSIFHAQTYLSYMSD